jgi:hypothetical protein
MKIVKNNLPEMSFVKGIPNAGATLQSARSDVSAVKIPNIVNLDVAPGTFLPENPVSMN